MPSNDESPPTPASDGDAPESERTLPKPEVDFAFGSQDWYWARCGSSWSFVLSSKSDWSNLSICEPYWVAFKHDTGFLIGGKNEDNEGRVVHSWNDSHMLRAGDVDAFVKSRDAYIRLHDWIGKRVECDIEKVRDMSISIGPKGSYFARCGTSHTTYMLPSDLEKAMEESDSPPVIIALGIKGSWVVLWSDGSRSYNLRHAYPSLASSGQLEDSSIRPVFVALSPSAEDNYFVVREDGACSYNVSWPYEHELHKMTDTYMRMRAKRDGSSFSHMVTTKGIQKQVRITPSSSAQETRTEALISIWRAKQGSISQKDVMFVGAVASGAGLLAKVAGVPVARSVSLAASISVGAALSTWYHST